MAILEKHKTPIELNIKGIKLMAYEIPDYFKEQILREYRSMKIANLESMVKFLYMAIHELNPEEELEKMLDYFKLEDIPELMRELEKVGFGNDKKKLVGSAEDSQQTPTNSSTPETSSGSTSSETQATV